MDMPTCQCAECAKGVRHASDCAVHNEPAMPKRPCDCGATSMPPLGARVKYASDVREGDLLVLPQPPLVRVTSVRSDHVSGVELLIFQADVDEMYLEWAHANGAPLTDRTVTFARWPFEAMQVFRRWDNS